jgi:hypothetical protein
MAIVLEEAAIGVALPHNTFEPHSTFDPHNTFEPQSTFEPHKTFDPQSTLELHNAFDPHNTLLPKSSVTVPVEGSRTATGDWAERPAGGGGVEKAACTSRYPAPTVNASL